MLFTFLILVLPLVSGFYLRRDTTWKDIDPPISTTDASFPTLIPTPNIHPVFWKRQAGGPLANFTVHICDTHNSTGIGGNCENYNIPTNNVCQEDLPKGRLTKLATATVTHTFVICFLHT